MPPERKPDPEIGKRIAFGKPESAPSANVMVVDPPENNWLVSRALAKNSSTLKVIRNSGIRRIEDIDLEIESRATELYTTVANDHQSPRGEVITNQGTNCSDFR